jgi:arylsulfatase A-like enzyme
VSRSIRYAIILVLSTLGTGLAAVGGWRYARASAPVNGPIILISVDSLRADRLPAYGYNKISTPAIDALAADGVLFERAYAHAPRTLPAHASLLSGRLPFETGVRDDVGFIVKPEEHMLAEVLRERGFSTGGIASTQVLDSDTGIAQGFDFYDADMPSISPAVDDASGERDGRASERIAERWLDSQHSNRVFLFLQLQEPHKPYAPPDRFSLFEPYDGEVAYSDEIIGLLMRYLKSHQLYDQSTIVLMADHGEGLGDHGEQEHGVFLTNEIIRVPLIIKQASNAGAGTRIADVVQQIDIVPTILELAKAPAPENLQGLSLKPLLNGEGRLPERSVYSEALYARYRFGWQGLTALTNADGTIVRPLEGDELRPDPDDRRLVLAAYERALDLAASRHWNVASALLQQIVIEDPNMIDAWEQLARVSLHTERLDQAAAAYARLVELGGSDRLARTEREFVEELKRFPSSARARAGLDALRRASSPRTVGHATGH